MNDPWTEEDLAAWIVANRPKRRRPSISDLEALLDQDEEAPIEILPNGEIRQLGGGRLEGTPKPLTMREDLGGEYAEAA